MLILNCITTLTYNIFIQYTISYFRRRKFRLLSILEDVPCYFTFDTIWRMLQKVSKYLKNVWEVAFFICIRFRDCSTTDSLKVITPPFNAWRNWWTLVIILAFSGMMLLLVSLRKENQHGESVAWWYMVFSNVSLFSYCLKLKVYP